MRRTGRKFLPGENASRQENIVALKRAQKLYS